ncbi:M20/M25/M40 family metallo-hydrolase, partial [Streptococcus suis]
MKPILFMSHYDVVAPGSSDPKDWKYGPFSGAIAEGRVQGRGTIDMKSVAFALLESADTLLASGFIPERDIYIALDPDEEVGGIRGAEKLAIYLKEKGLFFETIYDEGGIVAAPGTAEGINQ